MLILFLGMDEKFRIKVIIFEVKILDNIFVVVGLGNPGKQYDKTRHNVGFEVIDNLGTLIGVEKIILKHRAVIGISKIMDKKILLVKPQTFMNLSGESVRDIIKWYKVPIENLIVIYDDIDLDTGRMRIRKKGSAGSHNGMKSIIYQIQADNFTRIRIGIGRANSIIPLANYVLSKFTKEETEIIDVVVKEAAESAKCIIIDGVDTAMNKYNAKVVEE